jgi:hypothetical protein
MVLVWCGRDDDRLPGTKPNHGRPSFERRHRATPRPYREHLWASFAEREPNISSQLGVAERSALSEASAGTQRTEISTKTTPVRNIPAPCTYK